MLLCFAIVGIAFSLFILFLDSTTEAYGVANVGLTADPGFEVPLLGLTIPILEVQAYPATVTWKQSDSTPPIFKAGNSTCMMYLGKGSQTTVLYDVKNHRTVKFPTLDAIVEVDLRKPAVDRVCTPAGG
jgi:hypothetical protein